MSCDSLTFGGNAFQSLLAKNVKDRCINSRLKRGKLSLVLSPLKLYGTSLKLKKKHNSLIYGAPLSYKHFFKTELKIE